MALDMLAQAYEEEDSQTITEPLFSNDDISENDTTNEDTVIRKHTQDTYIDELIHSKLLSPRISESTILNQLSTTHSIPKYAYSYNSPQSKPINWKLQPSEDSLVIFEHLQNQIDEKRKENEIIKLQLKKQITEVNNLSNVNQNLQDEIKEIQHENIAKKSETEAKLSLNIQELEYKTDEITQLNGRISDQNIMIQTLCKQIEEYENVIEWLQVETNDNKITVNALEEWKKSIANSDNVNVTELEQKYDDEKENEKTKIQNANVENVNVNEKEILLVKEKSKRNLKKGKRKSINSINTNAENEANTADEACCYKYLWFLRR